MSEAAFEEVSVLSSIYCGEGEFQLIQQSAQDGLMVQINSTVGGERGLDVKLLFHLHPRYPSCPPAISVSSTCLSRTQCHNIRQKLLDQAAALPPEPMVHQLVEWCQQCVEVTENSRSGGDEEEVRDREKEEEWTAVLSLDHIRSRNRYTSLLERWTQQLQLSGRLLLGRSILVILQGARPNIKEFCRLLRTVKVDVDSSGKKCKERMMKVLTESPTSSSGGHSLRGFVVKNYESLPELTAAFQEINMTELYQQIRPSLSD
ncbi:RWD domain-containing protein 3 [Anoplopoma fimbria]|uniref:RWD domain-containing protein 3 n=1 Tax=Anoplopoma fimbria TaxID=229290 RepID=UPI0023EAFCC5|nr:RWD domain-containing protein 3 [Anoplopoma fimbria]XP_054472741.1 RWD domain-containing protein 3 [Anoplopoma fimbria]